MARSGAGTLSKRWKRRSAARPGELKEAALRLFAERTYAATTIEDIARAARVTVGTVYRYFPEKAALLAALVDDASAAPLLDAIADEAPRETLGRIWAASRARPHGDVLRILVAEGAHVPELVARYRDRVLEPLAARLAALPGIASRAEPLLEGRALLAQILGASLLAGSPPHVPPLVPQVAPDLAVARLAAGADAPRLPEPRPAESPAPPRRAGPEAW
jgi:AcrR family transcriptional regulator